MASLLNMSGGSLLNKGLPYDAEIEYLESSGTQYIDTDFTPNQDTIIESVVLFSNFRQNSYFVYGAGNSVISRNMEVYTWNNVTMNVNGNRFLNSANVPTTEFVKLFMSSSRNAIYDIHDNLIIEGRFNAGTFTCFNSLWLFGINRGSYLGKATIKSLKIQDGNTIVIDFIPVRVGTTGYMYDKVSGQLFGNSGTGNFILGNDI